MKESPASPSRTSDEPAPKLASRMMSAMMSIEWSDMPRKSGIARSASAFVVIGLLELTVALTLGTPS